MTDQELAELRKYPWMESRIPARDALSAFVPAANTQDPVIEQIQERSGASRWYPVDGGHRLLIPFDGEPYDSTRSTLEPDAWDHEHCDACGEHIEAMTLCHVTEPDQPYILLCATCYATYVGPAKPKPWWKVW